MRRIFTAFSATTSSRPFWGFIIRLAVLISAGFVLLAITLVGLFVVLPLMLVGGIALHFHLRRRLRRAQHRPSDGVIDAEYTVVDHR